MSFEQSLARLDEIVKLLESGNAPLEESMKLYEEGIALVRRCNGELERTEAKIKLLQSGENGKMTVVDFDAEEAN
ncbi:MAG: exodeoxyribonuclease VII small subunit [Clostridia bacterium]|nr:exodeoxyribonuclease VII small subunit [Clostridia bacterium]